MLEPSFLDETGFLPEKPIELPVVLLKTVICTIYQLDVFTADADVPAFEYWYPCLVEVCPKFIP